MGSGLAKAVGFFYFWPLTLISVAAFCACIILTRAEYDGRVRTIAGKRMVWARTFFGLGCFIYSLCVVLARKMTSVLSHADRLLLRVFCARVTFSRMSFAFAVQMKGFGILIVAVDVMSDGHDQLFKVLEDAAPKPVLG